MQTKRTRSFVSRLAALCCCNRFTNGLSPAKSSHPSPTPEAQYLLDSTAFAGWEGVAAAVVDTISSVAVRKISRRCSCCDACCRSCRCGDNSRYPNPSRTKTARTNRRTDAEIRCLFIVPEVDVSVVVPFLWSLLLAMVTTDVAVLLTGKTSTGQ